MDHPGGGLSVEDVESPDLAAQVGGIQPIGEPVGVKIEHPDVGGDRIGHVGRIEVRSAPACVPKQFAIEGIDDEDRVAFLIGAGLESVLSRVVAAAEYQHQQAVVLAGAFDLNPRRGGG